MEGSLFPPLRIQFFKPAQYTNIIKSKMIKITSMHMPCAMLGFGLVRFSTDPVYEPETRPSQKYG